MKHKFLFHPAASLLVIFSLSLPAVATAADCDPAPAGIVAWWQGEESGWDVVGGNNGVLMNTAGYATGEVGMAFNFPAVSNPYSLPSDGPFVQVPYTNLWAFGTNSFSIELWANFNAELDSATGDPFGGVMIADDQASLGLKKWFFAYAGGVLEFHVNGPNVNNGSGVFLVQAPFAPVLDQWYHLAVTRDGDLYTIYTNGLAAGSQTDTNTIPDPEVPLTIGEAEGFYFDGQLDEVSIYNRALSATEIAAIYAAGSAGKCASVSPPIILTQTTNETVLVGDTANITVAAAGTLPLAYQWTLDGTNLLGATNATLTLTNLLLAQSGDYSVLITNLYGSTNSAAATLDVYALPPTITAQPTNLTVAVGFNAVFAVTATGTAPLVYQWSLDGTNLLGATNAILTLINLFLGQSGDYSVLITNLYGSTNSAVATLYVYAIPPTITMQPTNRMIGVGSNTVFAVTATGTAPLVYQWSFDGANLLGATNATLKLTNLITSQSGDYSVLITNLYGVTNSAAAVLSVYGKPPIIAAQPTNQTVIEGATVPFAVTAAGTPPLSYQWSLDGTNVTGATNASLVLTNVQLNQAGLYSVFIASPYGSTNSANGLLTISPPPVCTSLPTGAVAWWQAESNALDSAGFNHGTLTNTAGFANGEVGFAFNFPAFNNPSSRPANGPYVQVPYTNLWAFGTNNFSIELWANLNAKLSSSTGNPYGGVMIADDQGSGGNSKWLFAYAGGVLEFHINGPSVNNGAGVFLVKAPFAPVTNRWYHLAITRNANLYTIYTNGLPAGSQTDANVIPAANAPLTIGAAEGFYFDGRLDEVTIYNRSLASIEIASIYQSSSAGKCPLPPTIATQPTNQTGLLGSTAVFSVAAYGTPSLAYQWNFDGTNIAGATNSLLTLTNVQLSQAGSYAVTISNDAGLTNSVNASFTVVTPPVIIQQPQSLSVNPFGSASFVVAATGSGPLVYQWQKNGTNLVDNGDLVGSASTNLTIASVAPSDAANYQVVITSPYANTNSAIAILTVPETTLWLGSTNAHSCTTIAVPVMVNALGVENSLTASVGYDPTKLTLRNVQLGTADTNASLQETDSQTNLGQVGFVITLATNSVIPPGTQEVAQVIFQTLPVTNNVITSLSFTNWPTSLAVISSNLVVVPAVYQGGTIQLTPAEYCADVYPRFNGDHQVTSQDWVEVGRMVVGLDVPTNSDEFLRADSAPRYAPDGVLTVADWVQAGRYAYGLDPLTSVTQSNSSGALFHAKPKGGQNPSRILQVATTSAQRGQSVGVPVFLICATNENAVGFTVDYNTNQLSLNSFTPSAVPTNSQWNVNSNQLGEVGLIWAALPGTTLPIGTNQVGLLTFTTSTRTSGAAALTLDSSVVRLQTADLLADNLPTTYINGAVVLPAQPALGAALANGQFQFTWLWNSGTFQVQVADRPTGPWTTLTLPLATNGANATSILTPINQQQYFRLLGQ